MDFIATTWNNGNRHLSGAGYGLKISFASRTQFFDRKWDTVILHLEGFDYLIEVNVAKSSFWTKNCGELINKNIGIWLQRNRRDQWSKGQPFRVKMSLISERNFKVVNI